MTSTPLSISHGSIPTESVLAALDLILKSEAFGKTPSLRQLLRYLVTRTVEGTPEQIKESVIAIEVFSRRGDFDGRIDNIVRVQAHRLRKLLETYYAGEGAHEPLRISVPKGSYVPQFEMRENLPLRPPSAAPAPLLPTSPIESTVVDESAGVRHSIPEVWNPPAPEIAVAPEVRPNEWNRLLIAFFCGAAMAAAIFWFAVLPVRQKTGAIPQSIQEIWGPVFNSGVKVLASYSNPAFLRVSGMPMLLGYHGPVSAPAGAVIALGPDDPGIDAKIVPKGHELRFSDNWTGTGEVLSVQRLTVLSAGFRNPLAVTPSRLMSMNEMRDANVIFVGAPSVNGALAKIGLNSRPIYSAADGRMLVRDPRPGEPQSLSVIENEKTKETIGAYAVFSVLPGVDPGHIVVTSAGNNTLATWAAFDFTTSPAGAAQLVRALKTSNGGKLPRYYQAVVKTEIVKGAVSNYSLVLVRVVSGA